MGNKAINVVRISVKTLTSQKFILSVLALVQIACCIALLYGYAIMKTMINVNNGFDTFNLGYSDGTTLQDLNTKIAEFEKGNDYSDIYFFLDADKGVVAAKNNYFNHVSRGRKIDNNSAENEIVVNLGDKTDDTLKIDDTMELFDKNYIVVGISGNYSSGVSAEVNYTSLNKDTQVYSITILNSKIRNSKQQARYSNAITAAFGSEIAEKDDTDYSIISSSFMLFLFIIVGLVLSTTSFAIGVKYIQDKRKPCFKVLNILGLSKFKTYCWMLAEIVIMCLIIWIVSALLYWLLDILVFSKILLDITLVKLIFADYFIVGTAFILGVGSIAGVISVNELYKSLKNNKRKKTNPKPQCQKELL